MTDAVHTSARDDGPDMFDGTEAAPPGHASGPLIVIEGVLLADAIVRTKPAGADGHPLPVLCVDLAPLNGLQRTVHAEQPFTEATRKAAEALAATLRKGMRVSLTTSLLDRRTVFPHAQAVVPSSP